MSRFCAKFLPYIAALDSRYRGFRYMRRRGVTQLFRCAADAGRTGTHALAVPAQGLQVDVLSFRGRDIGVAARVRIESSSSADAAGSCHTYAMKMMLR